MALTFPSSPSAFPPFSSSSLHPLSLSLSPSPPAFSLYLSRRNNANADPFNRRCHRRFSILASSPPSNPSLNFKSHGSSSSPSSPAVQGRFSKYSKPRRDHTDGTTKHPAFKQIRPRQLAPPVSSPDGEDAIRVTEKGVTYKLKDAPFEFQYSYTETPKVMFCTLDNFQLEFIYVGTCWFHVRNQIENAYLFCQKKLVTIQQYVLVQC